VSSVSSAPLAESACGVRGVLVSLFVGQNGRSVGAITRQVGMIVEVACIGVGVADDRAAACARLAGLDLLHRRSRYPRRAAGVVRTGSDAEPE
jgi:hypothetical protein